MSVPFCRTKCSYCNFASDVFSRVLFDRYVERVCADIEKAPVIARQVGGQIERGVDSVYLGGGTPTRRSRWNALLARSLRERSTRYCDVA